MRGADWYAKLFPVTVRRDRLLLVPGHYARGGTFRIFLLPRGYVHPPMTSLPFDVVELYGPVRGQMGWSEEYGWLAEGPWVDDFIALATRAELEYNERASAISDERAFAHRAAPLRDYP